MCRVGKGFGGSLKLRELERLLCRAGGRRWLRRDKDSAGGSGQVEGAHGVRQELETEVSPPQLSGRMVVLEMDTGGMGGRQELAWPGWAGGRGGQGVRGWLCGRGLAQLQDLWGLCPADAGLWPSCS